MTCMCGGKKIRTGKSIPSRGKPSARKPKKGGSVSAASAASRRASAQARKIATKTNPYKKGCVCS